MASVNKLMVVFPKYEQAQPKLGLSGCDFGWRDPLIETGFCNQVLEFHYDETYSRLGFSFNDILINEVSRQRPDIILYDPLGWQGMDVSRLTFDIIRRYFGTKVIMMRTGASGEEGHLFNESWIPFLDYIVFMDVSVNNLGYRGNPKAIQGMHIFLSKFFYDRQLSKDIDVSFIGTINSQERSECIEFLKSKGIKIFTKGDARISWDEYASLINRSKISLNFCSTTLRGRTFEAIASKSMLLEDFGYETNRLFDENKEFVMSKNRDDMLEKILYYLNHDSEREEIAQKGYEKVHKVYTSKNIWAYILNRAGFFVPGDLNYYEYVRKVESM